uniref:Uncharacterized protein n=1 Tax=Arundo donax TaxID=35708 RepID=A0A0A8XZE6_ARUDO
MVPQVFNCYGSMECSSYGKHILMNHEVWGVGGMNCHHGALVADSNVEEGACHSLCLEPEILCTHYLGCNLDVLFPKQTLSHCLGLSIHPSIIDHSWVRPHLLLHEVHRGSTEMYR